METIYSLFLVIGLMTTIVTSTETALRYFKEGRTWNEAQSICSNNNGKLMIPDASTIGKLNQTCSVAMNETIWVGEYTSLSEWIEMIGCYEEWNTNSSLQFTTNDPLLCVHLCQNYTFFGMKEDKCICIDQEEYNTLTRLDSQNCSYGCNGRMDVFCGGNYSANIYRKINRHITDEPKTNCTRIDCFCVSVDCQTIGEHLQTAYFSRPCFDDLTTVCDNYESVTGDAPSWKDAIQRCIEQQNSYPVNSDASISLCNSTAISWTSIFRDVFVATDNTGLPLSNIQGCKRMDLSTPTSGSSLSNCSEQLPFVCEIVLKPGQSENVCVQTTTPATTTEMTTADSTSTAESTTTKMASSTTSDISTSTTESTSSADSSLSDTSTTTKTTAGPLPGTSAQTDPGPVVGSVVAAVIVLIIIVFIVVFLLKRKRRKEKSFITYSSGKNGSTSSFLKPYLGEPIVGISNPNVEEMTEIKDHSIDLDGYKSQELVVPVEPEPSAVEGQGRDPENTAENESPETNEENITNQLKPHTYEDLESSHLRTTMVNNKEDYELLKDDKDVEQNVNQNETDNFETITNEISTNADDSDSGGTKDDEKVETIDEVTADQTTAKQNESTTLPTKDAVNGHATTKDKEQPINAGVNLRNKPVNEDKPPPGAHKSVIDVKM